MKVTSLFQENMILQREKSVPVWGIAKPGETITVTIQGQEKSCVTDENGNWKLFLDPLAVSFEEAMEIHGEENSQVLKHVAVGDVWLAGGQSNMEFHMRYDKDFDEAVEICENPNIRFFDCPKISYEGQEDDLDWSLYGFWRSCTKEDLQYYSAVAYYFAKNVYSEVQVPIGIIGCNWGGSSAVCWMDEETAKDCASVWLEDYETDLAKIGDLDKYIKEYKANPMNDKSHPFDNLFSDRMMYGLPYEEFMEILKGWLGGDVPPMLIGPCHEWRPCGLYHTMLKKVAPYAMKGVLWYQGESDAAHADIYDKVLEQMILKWRELWDDDFPFIMTQLAPFEALVDMSALNYPEIRRAQQKLTQSMKDVWCVATGDIGNFYDIHPKEKQPIGKRMALIALNYVYGMDVACESPVFKSYEMNENTIVLNFKHGKGLHKIGGAAVPLNLHMESDIIVAVESAQIQLSDDQICVTLKEEQLGFVTAIDMGYVPYYEMNVYNEAMLPMKPFKVNI